MPNATIPFDFRPSQVIQTTGSYTIPANKYAYVTACSTETTVTVDGNNWIISKLKRDTINSVYSTGQAIYTIDYSGYYNIFIVSAPAAVLNLRPWNHTTEVAWSKNMTSGQYLRFDTGTYDAGIHTETYLNAGDVIYCTSTGTHNFRIMGRLDLDAGPQSGWFPTGTILDGGNKTIALFDY